MSFGVLDAFDAFGVFDAFYLKRSFVSLSGFDSFYLTRLFVSTASSSFSDLFPDPLESLRNVVGRLLAGFGIGGLGRGPRCLTDLVLPSAISHRARSFIHFILFLPAFIKSLTNAPSPPLSHGRSATPTSTPTGATRSKTSNAKSPPNAKTPPPPSPSPAAPLRSHPRPSPTRLPP